MKRILCLCLAACLLGILSLAFDQVQPSYGQATTEPTPQPSASINGFHLVSPTEGWLLSCPQVCGYNESNQLSWTKDAGQTWADITPPNVNGAYMSGVSFVDNQHGAVLLVKLYQPFDTAYTIAQTSNGGRTWVTRTLSLFSRGGSYADYISTSLQFLDVHTGWLMLKELRNIQFDIGALFKTTDGGTTWTAMTTPNGIGDPAYFVTEHVGWIVGRGLETEQALYRTQDGGRTWQIQAIGEPPSNTAKPAYALPQFVNSQDGLLPVRFFQDDTWKNILEFYVSHDGGMTWQLDHTMDGGRLVALLDTTHWVVTSNNQLLKFTSGQAAPMILSHDPAITLISDLDYVSAKAAWAKGSTYDCASGPFVSQQRLLYTGDGGRTWQTLTLPGAPSTPTADATTQAPPLGSWSMSVPMTSARLWHTATRLKDGKVLVAGGFNGTILASAELYDPTTNTWGAVANMMTARDEFSALLLNNGKVLVAGGFGAEPTNSPKPELYDPATNMWSPTDSIFYSFGPALMVTLKTGKVLFIGTSVSIYDPTTKKTWYSSAYTSVPLASMATLLNDGRVLVIGDSNRNNDWSDPVPVGLYDPTTDTWSTASSLPPTHGSHNIATLLTSGKVLVVGGLGTQAEVYDPTSNTWSAAGSFATACKSETAILLNSGKVLVMSAAGSSVELYDPSTNTWSAAGRLAIPRYSYTATLLSSGKVLVAGGSGESGVLASTEVYDPNATPSSGITAIGEAQVAMPLDNDQLR